MALDVSQCPSFIVLWFTINGILGPLLCLKLILPVDFVWYSNNSMEPLGPDSLDDPPIQNCAEVCLLLMNSLIILYSAGEWISSGAHPSPSSDE